MSSPWFRKYNLFVRRNEKEKARNLLIQKVSLQTRDPLVYMVCLKFFFEQKEFHLLNKIFYQAFFLFPSSLFIKEVLLFIRVRFFSRTQKTAWFISEYILPLVKIPNPQWLKLYHTLSIYFYKRQILDSALLYSQMTNFYNTYPTKKLIFFIHQTQILTHYRNHYNLKEYLEQEWEIWRNSKINILFLRFLLPQIFFIPADHQRDNLLFTFQFIQDHLSKENKKTEKTLFKFQKQVLFFIRKILLWILLVILVWILTVRL